jgi:DNA-binding NarL/FixJ family response regulator
MKDRQMIRIILADDHKIVRDGLRRVLEEQSDMQIVGESDNGRSTVKLVEGSSPHVVVMDVNMPDLNGIEATRQITSHFPNVRVIGLSMYAEDRFVSEMLTAGASGYLPKKSAASELVTAIRAAVKGQTYLSPEVAGGVVEHHVRTSDPSKDTAFSMLSDREREVLQLLAEGLSVKEIADQLSVSVNTVHTHRQHIMNKLNLHSVAELTKYAIREGLTSL